MSESPPTTPPSAPQTEQPVGQSVAREPAAHEIDTWLAPGADGRLTLLCGKVELGTGVATALAQIVAAELHLPPDRIHVVMGDTARTLDQGYTAGSKTIQLTGPIVQRAARAALAVLRDRAAARLGVPVEDLVAVDGRIQRDADERRGIPYHDLIGDGFKRTFDSDGPLLPFPAETASAIGASVPRHDLPAKVTGGASFVHDLRLDGMLHGRVVRPWMRTPSGVGAKVLTVDESSVADLPGLVAVVRDGDFVGVVAEREEQAVLAADQLRVEWAPPATLPPHGDLFTHLRALPVAETRTLMDGDVEPALTQAERTLAVTYAIPFVAHASIGPSCAVADVRSDGVTVYAATQGVGPLRDALAELLDLPPSAVRVVYREGAGCYGHNGADDVAADAALLSRAVGRPVRVQWRRQDEFAWEPKSPAMLIDVRAGLDETGCIAAWDYTVRTPPHTSRPRGHGAHLLAGQLVDPPLPPVPYSFGGGDRNAAHVYDIPASRVLVHWLEMVGLRSSSLRSLGGWANTTATECFVDELAEAAGADPVAFRLRHLHDPRAREVIERAAVAADWHPGPRRSSEVARRSGTRIGQGIAFARYESRFTYVAAVADVEVNLQNGEVRAARVVVAHDCGRI
ncbi:MAG: molybdopterin-dependent oxidoreductase, partial [Chloroflexota bacterium]|nr:molybdopterin-dependent oxidoreductase [Chloroflexota bacterium]